MNKIKHQIEFVKNQKGNVLPYVLGWFLGIPMSVLLLIALFRTVF